MIIDYLVSEIKRKKNSCIVGIDPEWNKLPACYKELGKSESNCILEWAKDVIDVVAEYVPAVKPQMAFYEVYGADGVRVFEEIVAYAHEKGLLVIEDCKRNDIGNTARAYAYAHLSKEGPTNADFITVSPFLGEDSIEPFVDTALKEDKGIFVLVRTSNPDAGQIQEAVTAKGKKVSEQLAEYVAKTGEAFAGETGYSAFGAVVGATYPKEAKKLRSIMKKNYFLVPGYGAQGGTADEIVSCFNDDGLGALVSASRSILYHYMEVDNYDGSRERYLLDVKDQVLKMQREVYMALKASCEGMTY